MSKKASNIWLLITTILMFLLVAAYGLNKAYRKTKGITEGYKTRITLKETVVFDDQDIVDQYGGPVTLEAGTAGEIYEILDWYIVKHQYKHIQASFPTDAGRLNVILGYEMEDGADTDANVEIYNASINVLDEEKEQGKTFQVATPVININKINDSQKIVSGFKQMYERYYQRVNQTWIKGGIIGAICAFVMVSAVWLIKLLVRKEKAVKVLIIVTFCFDILMVLVNWIAFQLTLHM